MVKMLELVCLVADLSLLPSLPPPQRRAKFERTRCVIPITANSYHAPLQSRWKYGPHRFLRAGELVEFIISCLFGLF